MRLLAEWAALVRPSPFPTFDEASRRSFARGQGQAVLVLPASLRSDRQTVHVRALLAQLGYAPYGWELGLDLGPTRRTIDGRCSCIPNIANHAPGHAPWPPHKGLRLRPRVR